MFKEKIIDIAKGQARHFVSGVGYASLGYLAAKGFSVDSIASFYDALQFIGSLIMVFGAQGKSALNAKDKVKLKEKVKSYALND